MIDDNKTMKPASRKKALATYKKKFKKIQKKI